MNMIIVLKYQDAPSNTLMVFSKWSKKSHFSWKLSLFFIDYLKCEGSTWVPIVLDYFISFFWPFTLIFLIRDRISSSWLFFADYLKGDYFLLDFLLKVLSSVNYTIS